MSYQTVGVSGLSSKCVKEYMPTKTFITDKSSKGYIYFYKRVKYNYVKLLEKDLRYFINRINELDKGLFNSNKKVEKIKEGLKYFDNFKRNYGLVFEENGILSLIQIKGCFDIWKKDYDKGKIYPGFIKIYKLFYKFFNKLKIKYNYENFVESDNEYEGVYEVCVTPDNYKSRCYEVNY